MEELLTRFWPHLLAIAAIAVSWGDIKRSQISHQEATRIGFNGVNERLDRVNGRLDKHGEELGKHGESSQRWSMTLKIVDGGVADELADLSTVRWSVSKTKN